MCRVSFDSRSGAASRASNARTHPDSTTAPRVRPAHTYFTTDRVAIPATVPTGAAAGVRHRITALRQAGRLALRKVEASWIGPQRLISVEPAAFVDAGQVAVYRYQQAYARGLHVSDERQRLLDLFVTSTNRLPKGAHRFGHTLLCPTLEEPRAASTAETTSLCAWTDDKRTWSSPLRCPWHSRVSAHAGPRVNAYSEQVNCRKPASGLTTSREVAPLRRLIFRAACELQRPPNPLQIAPEAAASPKRRATGVHTSTATTANASSLHARSSSARMARRRHDCC